MARPGESNRLRAASTGRGLNRQPNSNSTLARHGAATARSPWRDGRQPVSGRAEKILFHLLAPARQTSDDARSYGHSQAGQRAGQAKRGGIRSPVTWSSAAGNRVDRCVSMGSV